MTRTPEEVFAHHGQSATSLGHVGTGHRLCGRRPVPGVEGHRRRPQGGGRRRHVRVRGREDPRADRGVHGKARLSVGDGSSNVTPLDHHRRQRNQRADQPASTRGRMRTRTRHAIHWGHPPRGRGLHPAVLGSRTPATAGPPAGLPPGCRTRLRGRRPPPRRSGRWVRTTPPRAPGPVRSKPAPNRPRRSAAARPGSVTGAGRSHRDQ